MRADGPEQALQRQIVKWLGYVKPDCIWFAVPMGGWRSRIEAAILSGMGAKAGVPDLVFLWEGGCGTIELKRPDGKGRQTKGQKAFEEECERRGVPYVLATSVYEVEKALRSWGRL